MTTDHQELERCIAIVQEHLAGAVMSKYASQHECRAARQMAESILRDIAGPARAALELSESDAPRS